MTFLFTHKLKNVGGPLLWEALGRGLLGLCLKIALNKTTGFFWQLTFLAKEDVKN